MTDEHKSIYTKQGSGSLFAGVKQFLDRTQRRFHQQTADLGQQTAILDDLLDLIRDQLGDCFG